MLVDNDDSFTYNLVQLIRETSSIQIDVINHAKVDVEMVDIYNKIIFSPGPSLPDDFPIMKKILEKYGPYKSILGICLGMQAIAEFYGAKLYNLNHIAHGQKQQLNILLEDYIFKGLSNHMNIGLYHSWAVLPESVPNVLETIALNQNGIIMAIRHKNYDIRGLQFHPESIITNKGKQIIKNWLSKSF